MCIHLCRSTIAPLPILADAFAGISERSRPTFNCRLLALANSPKRFQCRQPLTCPQSGSCPADSVLTSVANGFIPYAAGWIIMVRDSLVGNGGVDNGSVFAIERWPMNACMISKNGNGRKFSDQAGLG
jgi:hypothetical protein